MSKEMEELERRLGAVECHRNSTGPSTRSLGSFLKKKGKMGGGDSPAYYWGYVLLEKLRTWEGGKKSKARDEAEKEGVESFHCFCVIALFPVRCSLSSVDFLEAWYAKTQRTSPPLSFSREVLRHTGSLMGGTVSITAFTIAVESLSRTTLAAYRIVFVPSTSLHLVLTRYRFPGGLVHEDPSHCFILAVEGNVPAWEPESRQHKFQSLHRKPEERRAAAVKE